MAVIGVDGSDPESSALAFVHSSAINFPVGVDSDFQVTEGLYQFTGDPEAVAIGGDGHIVHIVHGPVSAATLDRWATELASGR